MHSKTIQRWYCVILTFCQRENDKNVCVNLRGLFEYARASGGNFLKTKYHPAGGKETGGADEFSDGIKLLTRKTYWLRMVYSTVDSRPSFVKGDRINNTRNSGIVNKFLLGLLPPPTVRPPFSPGPFSTASSSPPPHRSRSLSTRLIPTTDGSDSRTFSTTKPTLRN